MSDRNKEKVSVEERIKNWLKDSGFPLEMSAAKVFKDQGYEVRQSYVVKDLQEGKPREIDILATYPFENDRGITKVFCVLECKSSKNPWLVFDADQTLSSYNMLHSFALLSKDALSAISDVIFADESRESWNIFNRSAKCGYALRQPFVEKDTGYTAAMNVLKACRNMIGEDEPSFLPQITIAFPILVVDTPIFECSNSDEELVVKQVPHSKFLFSSYIPEMTTCRITIVHIDHLESFAKHYINIDIKLREMLSSVEDKAMEKRKDKL